MNADRTLDIRERGLISVTIRFTSYDYRILTRSLGGHPALATTVTWR
jgi:hypothetical protein